MSHRAESAGTRSLPVGRLVGRLFQQPISFVLTVLFLFFEYVRPQGNYPVLDVLPWARICLLGALSACLLEGKSSFSRKVGWVLVLGFTLAILLSIATAVYPQVGLASVDLWFSWLIVIYIVSSSSENEEQLILLIGTFILWNFKMSLGGFVRWASIGFQFRDWGLEGPSGWFQNSGEFGIEMAVFFPMAIYFLIALLPHLVLWKKCVLAFAAITAIASMAGSSSRGALLGGAAVGLWFLLRSPDRIRGLIVMATLALGTWLVLPEEQKARFASAGDDGTSLRRLTYWTDGIEIINNNPLLGIGYGNWLPYYRTFYNPKGALPHNIFIEAAAELGYVGLFVFVALIGYVFWENTKTRRLTRRGAVHESRFIFYTSYGLDGALIGYLVSGFFVTVLYYPYFWVNLAFVMALAKVARTSFRGGTPLRPLRGRALSRVGQSHKVLRSTGAR